ncbi:phosphotransferase KptA/Tpt1 [Coemansia mojavensis]|nr:phosphotransferase KptA/Tpt1 [Coemansia mojavensis]
MAPQPTTAASRGRRPNNDSPDVKLSKLLSYILRHGAAKEGLHMRDDGSIALSELKKHHKLAKVSFEQIKHIVDTNDKKRFVLFQDEGPDAPWYIRASQGHSIRVQQLPLVKLTRKTMPDCIIHGTLKRNLPAIKEKGLSKMNRNHIHFATGLFADEAVVSGMRATADTFIYIDKAKALDAGIEFYQSDNGVVLSEGLDNSGVIPRQFFQKIVFKD